MTEILPRLIRLRDAPGYCGMNINMFNSDIRPMLPHEIRVGVQGIAFDRLDLDAVLDDYIQRNKRRALNSTGGKSWGDVEHQVSASAVVSGTFKNESGDSVNFAKALEKVRSRKRSGI